jgi:hypothetical protein
MKKLLLNNLSIVAVLASFLLVPVGAVAAGMAFTFAGVVAMLCADYGRTFVPLGSNANVVAFRAPATELSDRPLAA